MLLSLSSCVLLLAVLCPLYYLVRDPLKNFPGPALARFTNLWRMYVVSRGRAHLVNRKLHDDMGSAVRLGPNMISLNNVELIKTLYANDERYAKSDYYTVNDVAAKPKPIETLFGTRSSANHQRLIKPIQKLYSMNQVDEFEPLLHTMIHSFEDIVRKQIANSDKNEWICDMEKWIEYFTWDAMSQMTFSRPLGFMSERSDIGSLLHTSRKTLSYFSLISTLPILDRLLDKNPIHRIGPPSFGHAAAFTIEQITNRVSGKETAHQASGQKDFLDHFLALKQEQPETVDDGMVMLYILNNVVAGSDTVATSINAILYYLLRHPRVHEKLLRELRALSSSEEEKDNADDKKMRYKELRKLPYLSAVISESMRLFPAVGLPLERVVPAGGLTLPDGRYIPQGTKVGMNAWVLHHDRVFGQDTDVFRPERWMREEGEGEEGARERVKRMRAAMFVFGYGRRGCIGRELALMEIYLFVGRLINGFEISLSNPEEEWKVFNRFFVFQEGTRITFRPRE